MLKWIYTETVLIAGKIIILRGGVLKLIQRLFGYRMTAGWRRAHVIQSFEMVLDTIETLPEGQRGRWDVQEIKNETLALLADMRARRGSEGDYKKRAEVIDRKIKDWRWRTGTAQ